MPMSKAGQKMMSNMKDQYGNKKGEEVFYAMENKGKVPGMAKGGMKKKKGYNEGGSVSTRPTRAGAQQYVRDRESLEAAERRLQREAERLGLEGFRERYGRSYRSVIAELSAARYAENAENLRGRTGENRENAFDRVERSSAQRARNYNKGGMVKNGNTDRRGKGMFYKSGSPRGYK